jgi:hypothetical protein
MSNDVTLFKNGVPDYLRNAPLDDITKSFLSGGGGGKRISIRGGVFRLVVDNKEIATNEERSMKIVVVNAAPKVSRAYYAGVYDPNAKGAAPTCWSADGDRPDASISTAQSSNCATCPQNIKGSGQGESRACRFSRRVAVVLENDLEGDVFQLTLPSQSIFGKGENGKLPLNAYVQFLAGFNVNITAVVTEMRFDTNSATPKLTFKAVRPLTEDEYKRCVAHGQTDEAKAAIKVAYSAPSESVPLKQLAQQKPAAKAEEDDEEEEAPTEPKKRESKKQEEPAPKKNLKDVLDQWDDEE